jgi:threonine/homoserine/homoserine lactone efflux protein
MFNISPDTLGSLIVTSFLIELTPGPNMAYLAILSLSQGRKAGFAATLGIATGLLIVGMAAALGLAAVISNSRFLYETLRWGGVAYLLWLAWDGWRDAAETSPARTGDEGGSTYFRQGLITNLLNPKAAVFYIALLPTFVDAAKPVLVQTIVLSMVYVMTATAIHASIVALASIARPVLDDPDQSRLIRRILSVLLALIAVWFAFNTTQPTKV